MPAFEFTGPVAQVYPFTRDARDRPVGEVQPGDVREFDEAPDRMWVPSDGAQEHPGTGEEMQPAEHPADGSMSPPVSNEPPPGPAVVPPAIVPGA
jgi:hypothetical protein